MRNETLLLDEQDKDEFAAAEIVELSTAEWEQVGGGLCDPGLIVIEK